jgi:hypothetical protein
MDHRVLFSGSTAEGITGCGSTFNVRLVPDFKLDFESFLYVTSPWNIERSLTCSTSNHPVLPTFHVFRLFDFRPLSY